MIISLKLNVFFDDNLYQYLVVITPVTKNILYSFYGNALGISLMITNSKNHRKLQLFHDGSPYHIETSPLICAANQCTEFYDRDHHHERVEL